MGQRMGPMPAAEQPAGQPDQQEAASKVGELVKSTGEGLQLLIKVFGSVGAPPESIDLLNQSMDMFVNAIQTAGGQGAESPSPERGINQEQAAGAQRPRPMSPAMG